ncbi:MAG: endonuclease/exonuclease/phosphatase family protein [Capsulimonadales bacterium]|nr:endonuclease/exonuclease/phosphatase family protein [Capsulimonadales bacterium]
MPENPSSGSPARPASPARRRQRIARRGTILPSFLSLLLTVGLWWAGEYPGERTWITTLFAYAPPLLLLVPTALAFSWSLFRRDFRALPIHLLSAAFVVPVGLGGRFPTRQETPTGPRFRLMTYNIEKGAKGIDRVAQEIRRSGADVVCLQETRGDGSLPDPIPLLESRLTGYRFVRAAEVAIASRYPLRNVRTVSIVEGNRRVALSAEVTIGDRIVTVMTVHPVTAATPETVRRHRGSLPSYLHRTTAIRARQFEKIEAATRRIAGPLILCGDFNTPPRGVLYRRLTADFEDAFTASGSGFGWTYPSGFPCLRIDHIFTRNGVRAVRTVVPAVTASDHRPVVSDLFLAPTSIPGTGR